MDRPADASWGECERVWAWWWFSFQPFAVPTNNGIIKGGGDTWLSPMTQCPKFPFPYPSKSHPSHFSFCEHRWLGYLIKMRVYMMPQLNICPMSRYPSVTIPKTETQHNQIDGGALDFSSAPRLFTIYVSCIFNVSGVKTGVLHSPTL